MNPPILNPPPYKSFTPNFLEKNLEPLTQDIFGKYIPASLREVRSTMEHHQNFILSLNMIKSLSSNSNKNSKYNTTPINTRKYKKYIYYLLPGHLTSIKYEFGDGTSLLNLCFLLSSSNEGCNKSLKS